MYRHKEQIYLALRRKKFYGWDFYGMAGLSLDLSLITDDKSATFHRARMKLEDSDVWKRAERLSADIQKELSHIGIIARDRKHAHRNRMRLFMLFSFRTSNDIIFVIIQAGAK